MAHTTLPRPTSRSPAPVASAPATPGRSTAVQAGVAIAVCLGLWAMLFAPVLERNAEAGPVGARRSAALAVLRPLVALADTLSLTRASEEVLSVLGRDPAEPPGGVLDLPEIDLPPLPDPEEPPRRDAGTGPVGEPPAPSPSQSPLEEPDQGDPPADGAVGPVEPDPIRAPSAESKLRVAIVGDSLSQGLGPAVAQWFDPEVTRVLPLGRQSTGLARLDYFNWQWAMRQLEEEFRPDLVFVMLGSNDNQAQVTAEGEVPVGSFRWLENYRERATAFLRTATAAGTRVVWVGIPVVEERWRWDFYRRVNDVYRDVARADPLATYLDAWELFEAGDGGYTAFLRNERGALQLMRAGDGIHFTPSGYAYLARQAIRLAADAFGLSQRAVTIGI